MASTRTIRLRPAIDERDALQRVFREVRRAVRENRCSRAVLVGHNAHFDLGFMNEAIERSDNQTKSLSTRSAASTQPLPAESGFGQTVLGACRGRSRPGVG